MVLLLQKRHYIIDIEKGKHFDVVFDCPAILISLMVYRAWHERLFKVFGTGASTILFEMGRELGQDAIRRMRKSVKNPLKLASLGIEHGQVSGWGKFSISKTQLLKMAALDSMTAKLEDSFIPKAVGNTGQASCHLLRGFVAGSVEALVWGECACEETKCVSKGDPYCEFRIKKVGAKP